MSLARALLTEMAPGAKSLLRVLACGSVDDGKSTLLGRLLYDSGLILEDHFESLERDSQIYGTTGGDLDFALLLDGLEAEREQGITIDVAYRYFSTARRAFIVADAPGHEQYTRNMATGASTSDLAIILVDARKGILPQTRRHSCIVSLLGIRHVVLAINKLDLVDFDRAIFERLVDDYDAVAKVLGLPVTAIPLSARFGDNVVLRSERMPWYSGPCLLEFLEGFRIGMDVPARTFRLPIQSVNRPHQDFRGFCGTIAGGRVRVGDAIVVAQSGVKTAVAEIVTMDGSRHEAQEGDSVTLVFADEVDASRGDLISPVDERPDVADQLEADIIWFDPEPMLPGRQYLMKIGHKTLTASITALKHKIDVEDLGQMPARSLGQNDIGLCNLALSQAVAFDAYERNRTTGSFILVDQFTNATVGAGMIRFALRRATNIHIQKLDIDKNARASLKHQKPRILWFTGLSGAGKSTIANLAERKLCALGHHTYVIDGDNVRHGLNRDLGFLPADRVENVRRVAETAKLMLDAGLIVLVSLISPFRAERKMARELVEQGEFIEIFVDAPLAVCRARDPKGLYKKAAEGKIPNFTGIDSPYEAPESPEIALHSSERSPDELSDEVIAHLRGQGVI